MSERAGSVRLRMLLIIAALLCLPGFPARGAAERAVDITGEARIEISGGLASGRVTDRDEETGVTLPAEGEQLLYITPGQRPVAAVYIEFGEKPGHVVAERENNGAWESLQVAYNPGYAQLTVSFPPQSARFRLRFVARREGERQSLRELYLFSAGELDADQAHAWQLPCKKADILFLAAHPDDELLWFGGAIPACVDAGRRVQVATLTCRDAQRRLELLNGLWHCGLRSYPDIGSLTDEKASRAVVLKEWGGEETVLRRVVGLIRRYRPEVLVTHGLDGEYGHMQHALCAELTLKAAPLAAQADYLPEAGAPWQVQKVYLHGGDAPTLRMDWEIPLTSLGGKTGLELAAEAFAFHRSQNHQRYHVQAPGEAHDSALFTLALTQVGEDQYGNDFFEHLDRKAQ